MKLNSTTVNGFGIKGMAAFGPCAWNVGSAPVSLPSRDRRAGKNAVRLQRVARTGKAGWPVAIPVSVARRCAGTETRAWVALDLAVSLLLVACPLMMGL